MTAEKEEIQSKPLSDRAFGGLLWQFGGTGTRGLLQIGFLAILARLVTPEGFGIVGAALIVIGLSAILSQLGVGPAIVQHPDLNRDHIRAGFTIAIASSAVIAVAVWLSAPLVASFFRMPELEAVLVVLSAVFVLRGIGVTAESLLQRELAFRPLAMIEVVSYGVGYGMVGTTFGLLGYGYWALVAGHVGQSILQTVMLLWVRPHPIAPRIALDASRELLVYGGGMTLTKGFNYAAVQGDNLVVGRWLGAEPLGIYGRAYSLLVTPARLFGSVIDRVLFPSMAEIQDSIERRTLAYRRAVSAVGLLALPTSGVVFVTSPEIVFVLLGVQWTEVILPLRILSVGLLFRTSYKLSDSLARATGAVYRQAWRKTIYAGSVFLGALAGIRLGVPGVAAGILLAVALNFCLMAHLALALTRLTWRDFAKAHWPGLLLAIVIGAVTVIVISVMRIVAGVPILNITIAGVSAMLTGRLVCQFWPEIFLGQDGVWTIRLIDRNIPSTLSRALFSKRFTA